MAISEVACYELAVSGGCYGEFGSKEVSADGMVSSYC